MVLGKLLVATTSFRHSACCCCSLQASLCVFVVFCSYALHQRFRPFMQSQPVPDEVIAAVQLKRAAKRAGDTEARDSAYRTISKFSETVKDKGLTVRHGGQRVLLASSLAHWLGVVCVCAVCFRLQPVGDGAVAEVRSLRPNNLSRLFVAHTLGVFSLSAPQAFSWEA